MSSRLLVPALCMAFGLAACGRMDDPSLHPAFDAATAHPVPDKPLVPANPERNVFWGDLHIHTSLSTDAFMMGVRSLPDDAYRFTKGGEIEHGAGYGIRISRPLDFAAVTDHGEYLGVVRHRDPDLPLSARGLRTRLLNDSRVRNTLAFIRTNMGFSLQDIAGEGTEVISRAAWQQIIDAAERHYQPGVFTTFIGYEWSSMPDGFNLHRNVIYRGRQVPELPFSSVDSEDPRDLWTALESQRAKGMAVMAIPHNGNVSNGLMYDEVAFDGSALNADYAERRMRNEPVSEIFQVKGSSETHPQLSPDDPFAGFELYTRVLREEPTFSEPKGSYIRDALRRGMEFSHAEGFNPYRFGVIGSSDSHNASSSVEEDSYHGKLPIMDGSAAQRLGKAYLLPEELIGPYWSAAGLAAVWAEENTRESIFDAMVRKETYATSGPRITLRFFGGWDYEQDLPQRSDRIALAEKTGVPMGGDLKLPAGKTPRFAVWAAKDPQSGNLDRLQIIKGWVDESGRSHEHIFDVALSDEARRASDGSIAPVGNTVDVADASYRNTIGATQLAAVWEDPTFNPEQEAFYYTRVIEIPTPRWSTYDAKALGVSAPEPVSIQERAVSSAIWYQPEG